MQEEDLSIVVSVQLRGRGVDRILGWVCVIIVSAVELPR